MKKTITSFLCFISCFTCVDLLAQHDIRIVAELDSKEHLIQIRQKIVYKNTSQTTLDTIYFLDWANAFSKKTTPLAKRFAENFQSNFHFERSHNRGRTFFHSISNDAFETLQWKRGEELDILKAVPKTPIAPGESYTFNLIYEVKLPDAKFTRYGHLRNGDFNLRYWFIAPAVFDGNWKHYSHKNLDDFYMPPSTFTIQFKAPEYYHLTSDLDVLNEEFAHGFKTTLLQGEHRNSAKIYLQQESAFEIILTDDVEVHTSIDDKGLYPPLKAIQIDRIIKYLESELGPYPFEKMVVSDEDYKMNPAYGLNQLPDFIRPFPDGFQYDIEQLKTIAGVFIRNTLNINPRDEHWFLGALQIYLMKKYTDRYYPDMKIVGNLSRVWGLRWFHAAQLDFNDQYAFLYLNSARLNLDQPLSTPRDSLIKFNAEIASGYKAGVGLNYLDEYIGEDVLSESLRAFYEENALKQASAESFERIIKSKTSKNIDWFFDEYVGTSRKMDYKISDIKKVDDSLYVTIKNNSKTTMPFPLFGMKETNIIYSRWQEGFDSTQTIKLPAYGVDRIAIDYEQIIPEYNKRNNYRKVSGLFKKPVQVRLFQDVEDPEYHQLFVMPIFEYNLYDGLTIGSRMYNKTVLAKNFLYKLDPQYGFTSNTLVGGGSLRYSIDFQDQNMYFIHFGTSYNRFSYNTDLFYNRFNFWSTIAFREKNLRSNKRGFINLRNIYVNRDLDLDVVIPEQPNYNVTNLQLVYSNVNLIDHFRIRFDYEYAEKFQKAYTTIEYRKLFLNNRQLNLRFFAGTFLKNNDRSGSDFFSFALDRPTDYLFDYNYYGRSESTGLFSQQLILAEGGFKSKFETPFANRWITTLNASTNIWRWIQVYGDVGMVNNRGLGTQTFFDTGVRLNLVADYFELYFPLYSSNGWEPGRDNYDQKIRFIVTLNPETLFRLFTRRWY
jgi:hypothetical protein